MKRPAEKNYLRTGSRATAALVVLLVAVSFIPPSSLCGVRLRRANILSDVVRFDDAAQAGTAASEPLLDEEEFAVDLAEVTARIGASDSLPPVVHEQFEPVAEEPADTLPPARSLRPDTVRRSPALVPIEDFSPEGRLRAFCDTLLTAARPVRIAFLGDSFVEGDILTADLRERLQLHYGGGGPGFAPMASPLAGFRRTVKTRSTGWTSYNIMQRKRVPEPLAGKFFVSGWVCRPEQGASTRWEMTDFREGLERCSTARLLFIARADSRILVTVNDSLQRDFSLQGDPSVRQIALTAPRIRSVELRVDAGAADFIGYGALFEGDGVVVDNYSVRSNNGQALFWTDPTVNAGVDAMLGYDLVILQYGLNIMQQGIHRYTRYGEQVERMIAYARECFPGAAVLVLGVSDRSVRTDAGFEPMDAVPSMTECQREAARNAGAAFWPTAEAMRSWGGMETFVRNGWAGKDYTHINYAGGRRVAWSLCDALNDAVREAYDRRAEIEARRAAARSVIDSARRAALARRLSPVLAKFDTLPAGPDDTAVRKLPSPADSVAMPLLPDEEPLTGEELADEEEPSRPEDFDRAEEAEEAETTENPLNEPQR